MLSPLAYVMFARVGLVVVVPAVFIVGILAAPLSTAAELAAGCGLTFLLIQWMRLALPAHRKADVSKLASALAAIVLVGRSVATARGTIVPEAISIVAGWAVSALPFMIESIRLDARRFGNTSYDIIRIEHERSDRRKASRAGQSGRASG